MTVGSEAPCRGGASLPLNIWFGVAHSGAHGAAWRAAGMGGLILPPDGQGAFLGQRARAVGQ